MLQDLAPTAGTDGSASTAHRPFPTAPRQTALPVRSPATHGEARCRAGSSLTLMPPTAARRSRATARIRQHSAPTTPTPAPSVAHRARINDPLAHVSLRPKPAPAPTTRRLAPKPRRSTRARSLRRYKRTYALVESAHSR